MNESLARKVQGINGSDIINLLSQFDDENIPYVSWKNNHELVDALAGNTDLDIFIPSEYRTKVLMAGVRLNWVKLTNPVAYFPSVIHLYVVGQDQQTYHLHVYFKVITGESWLKEFDLPLSGFLIEERIREKKHAIWVLNDKAQAYLFAIRHLLKGASLSSRVLYYKDLSSYHNEWLLCNQKVEELMNYGSIKLDRYLIGSGLTHNTFRLPKISVALGFRFSLRSFLRVAWYSLMARRVFSFLIRIMNKYFFKSKKIFPNGGLVIAISGVDGAGKSTMLNEVSVYLSKFLTVECFRLGKPQGKFVESVRKLVNRKKINNLTVKKNKENNRGSSASILTSISAVVLAVLRLRMAQKAIKSAKNGHLVLVDRWPTNVTGMMDGPKLVANNSVLTRMAADIEHLAYQRMPKADVCFFLEVPVEILIDRNRKRIKAEKETDEEILIRFLNNQKVEPLSRKLIRFDNNGLLEEKRKELLLCIWKEIVEH